MDVKLGGSQDCPKCGQSCPKGLILPDECPNCGQSKPNDSK